MFNLHEGHHKATAFFTPANAPTYDIVVNLATFGRDRFWKKQIIDVINTKLASSDFKLHDCSAPHFSPSSNLDLASGTGILSRMLERELENEAKINLVSLDLAFHYLQIAKKNCLSGLLTNGTAELLPYRAETFDSITSSYMSKYVNIEVVVKECWRVLKCKGLVVFHDFTYPSSRIVRNLWNFYFRLLRLVSKGVRPWAQVLQNLDRVIKSSNWVNQTSQALKTSGFRHIVIKFYTMHTSAIVIGQKP